MKTQIQILFKSDNISLIIKMLDNRYFLLIYNGKNIKMDKKEFLEPGQTIYNFSYNKIIIIEIQIYSQNFKMSN